MPKRIPILAASDIAKAHGCRQVIVVAWDGERTHVVTYGVTEEDCDQAAMGGNRVKTALGWPESLQADPSRVKKLKNKIAELEAQLQLHEAPCPSCGKIGIFGAICQECDGQEASCVEVPEDEIGENGRTNCI